MPEDNEKQNSEELYTNKYQKYIACSYGYQLECVHDKFGKPFPRYIGKDAVYNFIHNVIKENKQGFKNSTKCWICNMLLLMIMMLK